MKATDFEKDILIELFKRKHIDTKGLVESIEEIEVLDRDFTGVGFVTSFEKHPCLKVTDCEQIDKYLGLEAYLNEERIIVPLIFYIEHGYIETIEGYSCEHPWPEKIEFYEFSSF